MVPVPISSLLSPFLPLSPFPLFKRNIPVVPDILANAGGVVVSSFEWEQNLKGEKWSEKEINSKLENILDKEARGVLQKSRLLGCDLRKAAFVIALQRIQSALSES